MFEPRAPLINTDWQSCPPVCCCRSVSAAVTSPGGKDGLEAEEFDARAALCENRSCVALVITGQTGAGGVMACRRFLHGFTCVQQLCYSRCARVPAPSWLKRQARQMTHGSRPSFS